MPNVVCKECGALFFRELKGRAAYCSKTCRTLVARRATTMWRRANPEAAAAGCSRWDSANKERVRNNHYKARYGVSAEEVKGLLSEQGNCCAICRRNLSFAGRKGRNLPVVDHCHDTSKVRGILCTPCNLALGYLNDDPAMAVAAAVYLQENGH